MRQSLEHALACPDEPVAYIKAHSQEMDDEVIKKHIALYVNDYSRNLGDEGIAAVEALFSMAAERGLISSKGKGFYL